MAWVIPILLAYVPGVLIAFLTFTLLTLPYRVPSPEPPSGAWPDGQWPQVTIFIAARNEERGIGPTVDRMRGSPMPARSRSSWPTMARPTAPPS